MGHAAFERAQEDKEAHQEWLKEEEKLWAAMASPNSQRLSLIKHTFCSTRNTIDSTLLYY